MSDNESNKNERILTVLWETPKKTEKMVSEKPRKKRVVTEKDEWRETVVKFQDTPLEQLIEILENAPETIKLLDVHIRGKIRGYISQDKEKNIFEEDKIIQFTEVLHLLKTSRFECHYCKEQVVLLYEYVREPKQWTLERKNNDYGHNRDNVVLACLKCNLRRRCMKMERYELTKQIARVEKMDV